MIRSDATHTTDAIHTTDATVTRDRTNLISNHNSRRAVLALGSLWKLIYDGGHTLAAKLLPKLIAKN